MDDGHIANRIARGRSDDLLLRRQVKTDTSGLKPEEIIQG
jgi:hypothetical protein